MSSAKLMARNTAEVEEMSRVSEQTGQILVEAFMYRSHPAIQKLIDTVAAGRLAMKLIRSNFSFTREVMESDARYQVEHAGGGLMDVMLLCQSACAVMAANLRRLPASPTFGEKGRDDYAAGLTFLKTLMTFTCGMTVTTTGQLISLGIMGKSKYKPRGCDGISK